MKGVLLKKSLHQSPDHFVPSAKAVYKQGEIYTQTNRQAGRQTHIALLEITQSYTELSFIYVTCIEFCNYKAFYEVTSSGKREYKDEKTTCLEKMVYSAIETTCFGLYWSSSGSYNIK